MAEQGTASCGCGCESGSKTMILYACSGAANTGEMADRVARRLWSEGDVKKSCIAAIGAGLSGYIESAKAADNLVIDGCPVACGKRMFEDKGLPFRHLVLTEHGVEKGKTPVGDGVIADLLGKAKAAFGL
jgi:uncharacterized metal-binding protein